MISLAELVQSDIQSLKKTVKRYKETVYELEDAVGLSSTQMKLKRYLMKSIFDSNRKTRCLERKLKYLINGNGIQKEWSGE